MTKLKVTIAALSVFAFGLLTACGDGLKANGDAQKNLEQINRPAEESPEAEAESSVLEDAVAQFRTQVDRLESSKPGINKTMSLDISGMTLLRSDSYATAGNTRASLTLTMLFSCASSDDVRLTGSVDLSRLERGEDLRLSGSSQYSGTVRCTDANCNGLVVTVEKENHLSSMGIAHYAMEGEVTRTGPHGTLYEYNTVEANPRVDNFFVKDTVAFFREACATADAEAQLGVSGGANASDDMFDNSDLDNDSQYFWWGTGEEDDEEESSPASNDSGFWI